MNKKQIIVNAVISVLCVAIIIATALIGFLKNEVIAGAGNGTSARIETIEETEKMLSSFQNRLTDYTLEETTPINIGAKTVSVAKKDEQEYTSLTVNVDSSGSMNYESSSSLSMTNNTSWNTVKQSMSFDRQMTAYFTEKASYYISDFKIYSKVYATSGTNSDSEENETKMHISMRMHAYLEKDFALIKIDRMEYVVDGETEMNPANVLGKWVYFSDDDEDEYREIVYSLTSVNSSNFEVLAVMSDYIKNTSYFKKDRQTYNLRDEYIESFTNDVMSAQFNSSAIKFNPETDSGSFSLDLSDRKEPLVKFGTSSQLNQPSKRVDSMFGSYWQPEIVYKASASDIMRFGNINNTVITAPSIDDALTPEDLENIVREN